VRATAERRTPSRKRHAVRRAPRTGARCAAKVRLPKLYTIGTTSSPWEGATIHGSVMRACITGGFALLLLHSGMARAQAVPRLTLGTPVRATLAAGDTLRYQLRLPARHFVAGRVDQDGVDATVTITGPGGRRVQQAARVGQGGPEAFAFATDTAGRYLVEVTPAAIRLRKTALKEADRRKLARKG